MKNHLKPAFLSAFLIFGLSAAAEDTPCGPGVTGALHINGGGFVADTARVEDSAYVERPMGKITYLPKFRKGELYSLDINYERTDGAAVCGQARVSGKARVTDNALVDGNAEISGNARVSGNALVEGHAKVSDNARIEAFAWIYGYAKVSESAHVKGFARVFGEARVNGHALVSGYARVSGGHVFGSAKVFGKVAYDARVGGSARIGHYALVNGSAEVSKAHLENGKISVGIH